MERAVRARCQRAEPHFGAVVLASVAAVTIGSAGCAGSGKVASGGTGATSDADGSASRTSANGDAATSAVGTSDGGTEAPKSPVWVSPTPLNTAIVGSSCSSGTTRVGPSPLRRISRVEYNNMVRDLLGDQTQPANLFNGEPNLAPGVNLNANTYSYVQDPVITAQYLSAAEALAAAAVGPSVLPGLLAQVPNGACAQQGEACAQAFVDYFANKAFRGQYDSTESSQLAQIYSAVVAGGFDFAAGIRGVLTAVLTSPRFLYVLEFGEGSPTGDVLPLSPNELATRLSLFLWRSLPDDTLLAAAANGQLSTPAQVQAQAMRMLQVTEPGGRLKAQDALDDFTTQWLELEQSTTVTKDTQFHGWTPLVAASLRDETLTDVSQATLGGGALTDLLTSPASYVSQPLASYYFGANGGLPSGSTVTVNDPLLGSGPTTFVHATLPNRAGVLTSGSVMATQAHTTLTSSTLRGKLVREEILCDPVPSPPVGGVPLPDGGTVAIPPAPATLTAGETTRQQMEGVLAANPQCVSCHTTMDPIGYGFGHYDATGAYQAVDANGQDGGPPIDASGVVQAASSAETAMPFTDALDLANKLAADPQVAECYALEQFRYALGRIETGDDACSVQQVYASFKSSNLSLQSLLIAIVGSDAFRYRAATTAGSDCQ